MNAQPTSPPSAWTGLLHTLGLSLALSIPVSAVVIIIRFALDERTANIKHLMRVSFGWNLDTVLVYGTPVILTLAVLCFAYTVDPSEDQKALLRRLKRRDTHAKP